MVAEMALSASPSVFFDAVAVLAGPNGDKSTERRTGRSQLPDGRGSPPKSDRFGRCFRLDEETHVDVVGVTPLNGSGDISKFIDFARNGEVRERDTA
jgi:hypothetical protein